jgi:hypothetical protein
MAKKEKKALKVTVERASRWTVRGVPARLQKSAGDLARMRGQTLGQWLSEVVEAAITNAADAPGIPMTDWRQSIAARLAKLEALTQLEGIPALDTTRRRRRPGNDAPQRSTASA